jgi:hypothetical protein
MTTIGGIEGDSTAQPCDITVAMAVALMAE